MKILLADDHTLFRDGMRELLLQQWPALVLLESGTFAKTISMLEQHPDIDLILLDLGMPGPNYIKGIQSISACAPGKPLLIISARQLQDTIQSVMALGVDGYIPKSSDSKLMIHAIELVLQGNRYIPPQALDGRTEFDHALQLTVRQEQVLAMLIEGLNNKEICRQLGICERTVKMHISTLMEKFDAHNRTQLAVMAVSGRL